MQQIKSSNIQNDNQNSPMNMVKAGEEQNYYGRTYYESVPFSQANFAALQNILDKRNELLGTVKSNPLI